MKTLVPSLFLGLLAGLTGCASYRPMPVPDGAHLVHDARQLTVDTAAMPDARLKAHRFDPSDGFDMTELAMLAVANNPDLRLARADLGITRAQAFAAGLLPDPQLSLSTDHVLGSPPGATIAYSVGSAFDIGALLARSSTRAAAEAASRQADLDLLWQEWQTVAQARLAFVKAVTLDRSLALLAAQRDAAQARWDATRQAAERGLVTTDAVAPLLAAREDASRQWSDLARQRNQARHDLNTLLGIDPEVELVLVGDGDVPGLTAAEVQAAIAAAPRRRPDLLALRAGLEAQDDLYRGALRAQFPAITLGPQRARDTSNVNTFGGSLGLTLPLFNRNRGNIAIESATRDKLLLDYQQRLDAAASDAHRLLAEQELLRRQLADIDASLPDLALAARRAGQAFADRDIDALALANIEGALLARRLERLAVAQSLQEQAIALQALVGASAPTN